MIGSTLIGDNLGAGTYPSSLGLANLTAVRQLKADLSYKPNFISSTRCAICCSSSADSCIVRFLELRCAREGLEYANGTAVVEEKKKKAKKFKKQDEIQAENEQNIVEDQPQSRTRRGGKRLKSLSTKNLTKVGAVIMSEQVMNEEMNQDLQNEQVALDEQDDMLNRDKDGNVILGFPVNRHQERSKQNFRSSRWRQFFSMCLHTCLSL